MTTCPRCGAPVHEGARFCQNCRAPLTPTGPPPLPVMPPPKPKRRRWLKILVGIVAFLMTACVVLLVIGSAPDPAALALSVTAAAVPAFVYSRAVLSLDKYEKEPRRAIIGAFAWGAVGAVLFSVIAELIFDGVVIATLEEDSASFLTMAVGAPLIEEAFKGIALLGLLWFFRREFDNVLDGLVYGALIGLGFAMTENMLYFGQAYLEDGAKGLGELFVVRVIINGFGHALYTGTTGAAVGWSRSRYHQGAGRVFVPVLGYGLAVFQHFLWNSGIYAIDRIFDDPTIWTVAFIEGPLFVLPALLILFAIARTASRRELEILKEQLAPEVQIGVLTPAEYELLTTESSRKKALAEARTRGGAPLLKTQRRFFQAAAELAFRKYHLSRGEILKPGQRAPEDDYRQELLVLRTQLAAAGMTA